MLNNERSIIHIAKKNANLWIIFRSNAFLIHASVALTKIIMILPVIKFPFDIYKDKGKIGHHSSILVLNTRHWR